MSTKRSFGSMNDDDEEDEGKGARPTASSKRGAASATGGGEDPLEFFKRPKKSHAGASSSTSSSAAVAAAAGMSDEDAMESFIKSKDLPPAPATARFVLFCVLPVCDLRWSTTYAFPYLPQTQLRR